MYCRPSRPSYAESVWKPAAARRAWSTSWISSSSSTIRIRDGAGTRTPSLSSGIAMPLAVTSGSTFRFGTTLMKASRPLDEGLDLGGQGPGIERLGQHADRAEPLEALDFGADDFT